MRRPLLFIAAGLAVLAGAPAALAQSSAYVVPSDNPFVGSPGVRPEIFSYGLRNPYRFSFDRVGGDLVIGDVGQSEVEEIDLDPFSNRGGDNYGWFCFEGRDRYSEAPDGCSAPDHDEPVHERRHSQGACSITGGYVVRDPRLTGLIGDYLYGDFCQDELRAVELNGSGSSGDRGLGESVNQLVSFGEDAENRLYTVSLGGAVARLDPPADAGAGDVGLTPIDTFDGPTYVTHPRDGSDDDRLFVTERRGRIVVREGTTKKTFLDITDRVGTDGEGGLLSMAFAPDYGSSGLFYVYYTDSTGDVRVDEFKRSSDPDDADEGSRRAVIAIQHREQGNHKGGQLQFGTGPGDSQMLYLAPGDGGGGQARNAQDLDCLLGKVLRIDPRGSGDFDGSIGGCFDAESEGDGSGGGSGGGSGSGSGGSGGGSGGGGSSDLPPAPAADVAPPVVTLGARPSRRRYGALAARISCAEPCVYSASATYRVRGRRTALRSVGQPTGRLAAGQVATVPIYPTSATAGALSRARRRGLGALATITVTSTDAAGNVTRSLRRVRFGR